MKNYSNKFKTWVEIDKKAIKYNYRALRSLLAPKVKFMAVVKSNAYGHGLVLYAKEMQKLGVDWFGVDDIEEALILRNNGIRRSILVFGYVPESRLQEAVKNNVSITVSNFDMLKKIQKFENLKIHLKIDTGLGRQGFLSHQVHKVIKFIKLNKNIQLEGLYTHFAGVESRKFIGYTKNQVALLDGWRKVLNENGFKPIVHVSPSAGILMHPEYNFDLVRAGLAIYGLWPSVEVEKRTKIKLRPVLSWKTVIAEIKNLPKGSLIGYDLTEKLKKDSTVAVLPVGYCHGLPISLSKRGEVVIKGRKARILGRVSMGMIVVDVTSINGVKRGDEVVLIGRELPVEDMAELAKTINYELITRINPEIPRIYT